MIHKKTRQRGVSIIEIVVSMVILFLVMMALAFVYPQGRKLTDTSDNRTKATEIARTILEEIQLIPFVNYSVADINNDPLQAVSLSGIGNGQSLEQLVNRMGDDIDWPYHHYAGDNWADNIPFFIADNVSQFDNNEVNHAHKTFCLSRNAFITDQGITIPRGIDVTILERDEAENLERIREPNDERDRPREQSFVIVTVTISWPEYRNDANPVFNFVSLNSAFTGNKR